ncbi:hypothetical protein IV203_009715 [Nitzschia inconspicua]|uniref:Uncharacterized protein n=1 Tax=Nitzschia inconspicua TaxID=303405 RepID=A0A9K3KW91_9STRA|nr:hypothetical protein IV203_009715 [Nitzschia inconspicua]
MKEIPIFFPNNIMDPPPRYVVDYRASCLAMTSQNSMSAVDSSHDDVHVVDEALTEAASVSEVQLQGKNFLVTTSALVDQPEVISVALFPTGGNNQLGAPKTVELNTGDLVVVSARAVSIDPTSFKAAPLSPPLFRLVLVGSQGIIVSLALDENLVLDMANPLKVLFPEEYVPVALQSHITSALLRPTMVEFLSSKRHHIVIALSPSLMIVDWMTSGKCEVWTESQCREDMKARQRILDFSNFAFGRIDNGVVDMAPTAAVCVSSNKPKGSEGTDVVFTIHSDASIRKWLVDTDKSLRPFHVCTKIAKELPSPSTWNDARNSVAMSARLYGQTFALGLYIKTNSILEGESACNIWAFNGQITSSFDESLELWIPNDVQNVVSMAFNPTDPRCSLCAVFEYCKGTNSQNKSGIHVVMYPHDHIVIVGSQPEFMTTDSLDQIAAVERDRINALSYGETVLADFDEEESSPSVDEALNAVDALHLKFLFRPMFPRGNGTVLPPSDSCIRRALSKLVSNYRREQGMSIELETIKTLYEWRKRDKYRERISSFTNKYGRNATNSSQPMLESVYESYVRISREEVPKEEIGEEIVIEGQTENGLLTEIETHQNRWRQLLRQIWEEEHNLRLPLHVAWLNRYGLPVMLRGGVSSILAPPSQRRMANPLYLELDDACSRILSCIEADPSKSRYLYNIEGRVATYVSRFLLKPYPQSSIEDDLTCLGRWAAYKQGDLQNLRNALVAATNAGEILDWVGSNQQELLFSSDLDLNVFGPTDAGEFPNNQLRQAACTSIVRTVDAIRRAQLGKCLLLSALGTEGFVDKVALRRYMSFWKSAIGSSTAP